MEHLFEFCYSKIKCKRIQGHDNCPGTKENSSKLEIDDRHRAAYQSATTNINKVLLAFCKFNNSSTTFIPPLWQTTV